MRVYRVLCSLAVLLSVHSTCISAQSVPSEEGPAAPAAPPQDLSGRPSVFFDCQGPSCDSDYYRTEITWVNWVRDQEVADVHVIVTSLPTGAGGREYQLDFMGVDVPEGYRDVLVFQTLATDTQREELDGMAHTLSLGLARYANVAGYRGLVRIQGPDPESSEGAARRLVSSDQVDDPWNLWVFRFNGGGDLEGESTREETRLNANFSASRVTPTWKLNFNGNTSFERQRRELSEDTVVYNQVDWGFTQLAVYAVAPHWSIGLQSQSARMVSVNQDFRFELTPAVEYSFFPYDEATRRSLTAFYTIGPGYRNYIEETIYGEFAETRMEQALEIEFSQRQAWGNASITMRGSHFLHDLARNNISLRGNVDFRVFRGFSVNARGNVAWVNDQIYLSNEGVTDEEALLDLRRQGTEFEYSLNVGFSVQFGSIFNNVVNNRLRGMRAFGGGFGR